MINIITWNCAGGLRGKLDEVKELVNITCPDLLFICEAEFNGKNISYYCIPGYHLDIADSINLGKARIICYVKSSIKDFLPRVTRL